MEQAYTFFSDIFLRSPFYSFARYDLERLPEVIRTRNFQNAIYLASPGFYRSVEKKAFDFDALSDKERHTLYKYYNRMCFRPTPFGSFASFSLIRWGKRDTIRLTAEADTRLHLLPSRELITVSKSGVPALEEDSIMALNPTLYRVGNSFRFCRDQADEKGHYRFSLGSVEAVHLHRKLVAALSGHPLTAGEVAGLIRRISGCTDEDALWYLRFLAEVQVVYTHARGHLILTGSASALKPGNMFSSPVGTLSQMEDLRSAAERAWGTAGSPSVEAAKPAFYGMLERHVTAGALDVQKRAVVDEIARLLQHLATPLNMPDLKKFVDDFEMRFGMEKVPLLRALDPDTGIVYGSLFVGRSLQEGPGNLQVPAKPGRNDLSQDRSPLHSLMLKLWMEAGKGRTHLVLEIKEEDIEGLPFPTGYFPNTMPVMFRSTENGLVVGHAGGATATALTGRFSAASDAVAILCREIALAEERANPEILFADIGMLSNIHSDNINLRQQIYSYEIPVNVFSALPEKRQLRPEDLRLSVKDGELLLESAKTGKRVMPRLATAYRSRHNE